MATDSGGIIKLVLLAGGAYLIYSEFFATPAAATTTTTGGTTPPVTTPPYQYNPPSVVQQLQNYAGQGITNLDADQWSYYWQTDLKKTPIDPTVFGALFFPSGRPSDPSQNPTMTADQFIAALATKGISGYRGMAGLGAGTARPVWLPVILQPTNGRVARPMVSNYRRRVA